MVGLASSFRVLAVRKLGWFSPSPSSLARAVAWRNRAPNSPSSSRRITSLFTRQFEPYAVSRTSPSRLLKTSPALSLA